MKKQDNINDIRRKFKRILSMESRKPNYFSQYITDVKAFLVNELNKAFEIDTFLYTSLKFMARVAFLGDIQ